MNLHIIEISPHIYAGSISKNKHIEGELCIIANEYVQPQISSGGISFLFNKIYEIGQDGLVVFCADRNPTIKKEMLPSYKANRTHNSSVEIQKIIAEEILEECGYQVLAMDGYESDDIVWSLCNKYKDQFDHVYIHTDDHDLYINIDDNVTVLPARKNGQVVTKENYRFKCDKDCIVEYNSIGMLKVICGDSSDNVKALPKDLQQIVRRTFFTDFYYEHMHDKNFMRTIIETACPAALPNFDVIYPLDVEVSLDMQAYPDLGLTPIWGKRVGNNKFDNIIVEPESVTNKVREFFSRGYGDRK